MSKQPAIPRMERPVLTTAPTRSVAVAPPPPTGLAAFPEDFEAIPDSSSGYLAEDANPIRGGRGGRTIPPPNPVLPTDGQHLQQRPPIASDSVDVADVQSLTMEGIRAMNGPMAESAPARQRFRDEDPGYNPDAAVEDVLDLSEDSQESIGRLLETAYGSLDDLEKLLGKIARRCGLRVE